MMLFAPFLLSNQGMPFRSGKVDVPQLDYLPGAFQLRSGGHSVTIPLGVIPPKAPTFVTFRRDEHYVVWDSRGLTIRHADSTRTLRLGDVPTAPRLYDHETVVQTLSDLESGLKKREASALSGALRFGPAVYLLVRWDDKTGKPWTEALVRVKLEGKSLSPEVIGRFDALSIAYKSIDDRLFLLGSQIAVVGRQGKTWGVASFDPATSKFDFRPIGSELLSYLPTGTKTGLFMERSPYGTTIGGRVDLGSGYRKPLFESRGNARFIDALQPPLILMSRDGESRLRNGDTGAEIPITSGSGVGRAGENAVVWTPGINPNKATLYDPANWKALAKWTTPKQ